MRPLLAVLVAFAVGAACSDKPQESAPPRSAAEQRRIDSTVGASKLPGSKGVQGALRASDSAAARAKVLDSLSRTP